MRVDLRNSLCLALVTILVFASIGDIIMVHSVSSSLSNEKNSISINIMEHHHHHDHHHDHQKKINILNNNDYIVKPSLLRQAPYADWAHKHWVWYSNDQQSQEKVLQLVKDYQSRDIPVGAVNIDSGWSTGYNNFVWNLKKFPNPKQMIDELHDQNIKVILWATSMVNNDSSNFQEGLQKGYYLNNGTLLKWWHGRGAFLDYTYDQAVDWWHKAMDECCLDIGVDGWKCDGTDPYVAELILPRGHHGFISEREYANLYYRDFFYHTRKKRGPEALIMARPVDNQISKYVGYFHYAPRDVVFSGWVGDQDASFDGLQQALFNMIHSAFHYYVGYGSDIGGYRADSSAPLGRERELFIRWVQFGAFSSLMENGGNKEHRPWIFDEHYQTGNETTDIYRRFVHIHHELVPYLLNAGTIAYELGNTSIMIPLASKTWFEPNRFDYQLWHDIFIAPVVEMGNILKREITFPKDSDWVYYFDDKMVYKGGEKVKDFNCPLDQYPAFKRKGSIIPLHVQSRYTNHGSEFSTNHLTLLFTYPTRKGHSIELHELKSQGFTIHYNMNTSLNQMEINISAPESDYLNAKSFILLLRGIHIGDNDSLRVIQATGVLKQNPSDGSALWRMQNNMVPHVDDIRLFEQSLKENHDNVFHVNQNQNDIGEMWIKLHKDSLMRGSIVTIRGISEI